MNLTKSRYVVLSDRVYRRPNGAQVRLGYLSRRARIFTIDSVTAGHIESGQFAAIKPVLLAELKRLGVLVDDTASELSEVVKALRVGSDSARHRRFTIMPTAYCNMGCSYCGQEHYKSPHSGDRITRLVSRVQHAMAAIDTDTVSVTWFGGEPLLAYRLITEMSEMFVQAAREENVFYYARMATNGSLITTSKLVSLHEMYALRDLDVTIDGPQEMHDRRRILKSGKQSYQRCTAVLSEIASGDLAAGLNINIRVNVDSENEPFIDRLLEDLAAAGLTGPRFTVQLMPVHSWGNDVSQVEIEARSYAEKEALWLRRAVTMGFRITVLPTQLKSTTCMATTRSGEIQDPSGKIYTCSEHPLVPGVRESGIVARLAELPDDALRPPGQFDDWYDQVSSNEQACHSCAFLPVCGGSCPKLWREGHLPCPSFKFNVQDRFDLVATERMGLAITEAEVSARG